MQTFLPFASFEESAKALDDKRLGKQRGEVLQILNVLENPNPKGWANHPAVKMWRGFEGGLIRYGVAICDEWISRGFNDTVRCKLLARLNGYSEAIPPWVGGEDFHSSHRANLLRKDEAFYRKLGWTERGDEPYVWPVS